jgi:EAL domain-containing protein (putative c-di-GMP-specific phosphodiesterase class I)
MKQADLALRAAKQDGGGRHRSYSRALDGSFRNRVALRQSLREAISEKKFELHYQPIVAIASGEIVGAEALVRWPHPGLGLQPPSHFIPIAEETGLIVPLGEWIIRDAFQQAESWRQDGFGTPSIAVNLSSRQLRDEGHARGRGFIAQVERILAETGANPRQFNFEMTESVVIESSDETLRILRALKSLGFLITLDDFGTGHSTFKYLRDFPVDKIKIDRNFVSRIDVDKADETIIRAMINLARSLGVKVVAEGIETVGQRDFLVDAGCELGQGYMFSMPLRAEDFAWMLARRLTLPAAPARQALAS